MLDRYGLENYFPQHVFETVIGHDLSAHFPLDPRKPVKDQIRGYNKNMNVCWRSVQRLTTWPEQTWKTSSSVSASSQATEPVLTVKPWSYCPKTRSWG